MGSFTKFLIFIDYYQKSGSSLPFGKGPFHKYPMRPVCQACNQRPCAVNYYRDGVAHYRRRCETCQRKGKGLAKRKPRWESQGFKKKLTCDRCGFRARWSSQILVYHIDGDLNNAAPKNLKCICLNCVEDLKRTDLPWRPGDIAPDY